MSSAPNVFTCYAREDAAVCAPLISALADWGVASWHADEPEHAGGITERAQAAISGCDLFLRVCTYHTPKSYWMSLETGAFLSIQAEERKSEQQTNRVLINLILDPDYQRMPFDASAVVIDAGHLPPPAWTRQLRTALGLPALDDPTAAALAKAIQTQVAAQAGTRRGQMTRRRALQLGAGAVALAAVGSSGALWLTHRPPQLHNYSVPLTPAATGADVLWSFQTGDKIQGGPALAGTTLYIGSLDGNLYALDTSNKGKQLWRFNANGPIYATPIAANGIVYCERNVNDALGNRFFALDAATGNELWETGTILAYLPPIVTGGKLYLEGYVTDPSLLRILDAKTGEDLKIPETRATMFCGLRLGGDLLYTAGQNPDTNQYFLFALRLSDGQPAWQAPIGEAIRSTPAYGDGRVYIGSTDHHVYCFDAQSGKALWQRDIGAAIRAPGTFNAGVVYIGNEAGTLTALDAATGTPTWTFQTGDYIEHAPAIAHGRLYFGSGDHSVYALDLTGKRVASYATHGAIVYGSPVVGGDGTVYVGTTDRYIYALKLG
jgi:serine/threonine-protein kinase